MIKILFIEDEEYYLLKMMNIDYWELYIESEQKKICYDSFTIYYISNDDIRIHNGNIK